MISYSRVCYLRRKLYRLNLLIFSVEDHAFAGRFSTVNDKAVVSEVLFIVS